MIGDGLTKDLSSLHPTEDGTGRRAGPSPLRVNRHRETQSVSQWSQWLILMVLCVKNDGGEQSASSDPISFDCFAQVGERNNAEIYFYLKLEIYLSPRYTGIPENWTARDNTMNYVRREISKENISKEKNHVRQIDSSLLPLTFTLRNIILSYKNHERHDTDNT